MSNSREKLRDSRLHRIDWSCVGQEFEADANTNEVVRDFSYIFKTLHEFAAAKGIELDKSSSLSLMGYLCEEVLDLIHALRIESWPAFALSNNLGGQTIAGKVSYEGREYILFGAPLLLEAALEIEAWTKVPSSSLDAVGSLFFITAHELAHVRESEHFSEAINQEGVAVNENFRSHNPPDPKDEARYRTHSTETYGDAVATRYLRRKQEAESDDIWQQIDVSTIAAINLQEIMDAHDYLEMLNLAALCEPNVFWTLPEDKQESIRERQRGGAARIESKIMAMTQRLDFLANRAIRG